MLLPNNTHHQPPLGFDGPDYMLVNDGGDIDVHVCVGKTYRFRFINMAAIAAYFLHFHNFDPVVIMTDASYVKPEPFSQIRIGMGQRYDILVTIEERHAEYNWPFLIAQDYHKDYRFDTDPPGVWPDMFNKYNVSGYMILDENLPWFPQPYLTELSPFNELNFKPLHNEAPWGPVTKEIVLDFLPEFDTVGQPIMTFNGRAYITQTVPTLYTALSVGEANRDPRVYGQVNPFILDIGDVVQIVINNNDTGIHPYHLHGHQFQILDLPPKDAGIWISGMSTGAGVDPPRRDTVNIEPNSYGILRIRVEHPGIFLLHCHIDWHIPMGLVATFIQGPELLRNDLIQIPQDHLDACKAAGIPTQGNAAGNLDDPFNTDGMQTVHEIPYQG